MSRGKIQKYEEFFSVSEAAATAGVTIRAIYLAMDRGDIEARTSVRGTLRIIPKSALEHFMRNRPRLGRPPKEHG